MSLPASVEKFFTQLRAEIDKHVSPDEAAQVDHFAHILYQRYPFTETVGRSVIDLFGNAYGSWKFVQKLDRQRPKIRIFNPDYEQHGWVSNSTIVAVLSRDMPFIRDSIRAEFHRRGIAIHQIYAALYTAERNAEGQLEAIYARAPDDVDDSNGEVLLYLEVARHSDSLALSKLKSTLEDIMSEVRLVVDDFAEMTQRVHDTVDAIANTGIDFCSDSLKENVAFLHWSLQNNFTFLGFERLAVSGRGKKQTVKRVEGSALGLMRLRESRGPDNLRRELVGDLVDTPVAHRQVTFAKSLYRSRVHRDTYPQYFTVKVYNDRGDVVEQMRFLGLFTSPVYTQSTLGIPIVRSKVREVIKLTGFKPHSHDAKEVMRIMEVHPRDELFQSNIDQLLEAALEINRLQERRKIKMLVRRGTYGRFVSCLVFTPRDIYHTELRVKIQRLLSDAFGAQESEFTTFFSESILTRTHFFFRLGDGAPSDVNLASLESDLVDVCYSWEEQLHDVLIDEFGEEHGTQLTELYRQAFQAGYREDFAPRVAINDIRRIDSLVHGQDIAMSFYRMMGESDEQLRFRLYQADKPLPLSDVIPVLENLGLRVIGENPYDIRRTDGRIFWVHDFSLNYGMKKHVDVQAVSTAFQEAFAAVWHGEAESDSFNKLILGASLNWRQIALLRAYSRYMKQIRFPLSGSYIADALLRYPAIAELLLQFFVQRFDPDLALADRASATDTTEQAIIAALDSVSNLNDDTIFRLYVDLFKATLRTNFFQCDGRGEALPTMAFKMAPQLVAQVPKPRPMFEIFVYSPRVEGVHLRGGKVARGGLRWSDRHEDFRTEVLGLVKAQQVKNSVIVPVGAKGGFVCRQPPLDGGREAFMQEGIACYQLFIQSLLDVTDNLVDGAVVAPERIVRWDEDDPYLVVAADKGTATFSDIANAISEKRGFWLGDAFASGGSHGFDHKKMGITARGAWVSVQRHFLQLGIDVQAQDFNVVGIGDMAGDVFGNGMLLSEHICLVAAFNHLHIFIDPNPDSAASFKERKRLFELPRSSWEDYNAELISAGGGIFSRAAKSIAISPEMKTRFDINENKLTPNELISALLKSPVDLLWNGGIGTYVKSAQESHADVGDKANDSLRVDGGELRCKVVGEGGNLGMTQRGRIEYAMQGGLCNTDFIDNSAGVDCSDHEVNIKILLNELVSGGDMTGKQRNALLEKLIDPVAELVLRNNFRQAQALSVAQFDATERIAEHQTVIQALEGAKLLDRKLEFLPSDDEIAERRGRGEGLTRPEYAILMSYLKGMLKDQLVKDELYTDPYIVASVEGAFPQALRQKYAPQIYQHKLLPDIVATQMANNVVNYMGLSFIHRLRESTGGSAGDVLKAYTFARDVFDIVPRWQAIERLQHLPPAMQMHMMRDLMRLGRRATRWALRNRRQHLDIAKEIAFFKPQIEEIANSVLSLLRGRAIDRWRDRFDRLREANVPEDVAQQSASSFVMYSCLAIIDAAQQAAAPLLEVADVYFDVSQQLDLDWFATQLIELKIDNQWQAMARETFMDDLDWQHRAITVNVLHCMRSMACDLEGCRDAWQLQNAAYIERWRRVLGQLQSTENVDFAMYSVATRELFDLAQASAFN